MRPAINGNGEGEGPDTLYDFASVARQLGGCCWGRAARTSVGRRFEANLGPFCSGSRSSRRATLKSPGSSMSCYVQPLATGEETQKSRGPQCRGSPAPFGLEPTPPPPRLLRPEPRAESRAESVWGLSIGDDLTMQPHPDSTIFRRNPTSAFAGGSSSSWHSSASSLGWREPGHGLPGHRKLAEPAEFM